jgi:hypothetical protein
VQTKARKPKNHLLYKNFRIHASGVETTEALALMMQGESSRAQEIANPIRFDISSGGIRRPSPAGYRKRRPPVLSCLSLALTVKLRPLQSSTSHTTQWLHF